jgi:predicted nucleic-acid-binding Zn-ribbon protein
MSTNLRCPKCAASEYIIEENDIELRALTGGVSQGVMTPEISGNSDLTLTCASCGYQYKSGDYQRKQDKVMAARLALMATQSGNQIKAAIIYGLLGVFVAFIAYKFFLSNWTIFGFIFSVAALALLGISITGLILAPKRK